MKTHIDKFYKKNKRVDYLVNTTGVLWFDKDISAVNIDDKIWDKVFKINLKSMMYLSKIVVPLMKKNNFGSMVHLSSIDALSGDDKPQDAYGASKAAMIRLSKSFAIQFANNKIRSNIILPGPGLGDLYVSAIGGRNSLMGKYLGEGHLYNDAKEKFMKDVTEAAATNPIAPNTLWPVNIIRTDVII